MKEVPGTSLPRQTAVRAFVFGDRRDKLVIVNDALLERPPGLCDLETEKLKHAHV
jgi:hypothetical protein